MLSSGSKSFMRLLRPALQNPWSSVIFAKEGGGILPFSIFLLTPPPQEGRDHFSPSFPHSFSSYLLSTYCICEAMLSPGDRNSCLVRKTDNV
jgi:hypothetical protein